jgi:hypothetical protein
MDSRGHTRPRGALVRAAGVGLIVAVLTALAPAALAAPPHGDGGHPHNVSTGSGCRDIDAVAFNAEDRGLHRGANESGQNNGPWHGPCQ